jgi:FtsP/CotA-like multicopper oxidase with cupredoxin domain
VVYNLYATDGYVEMADGTAVYTYGFVGGRQGVPLDYQTSFCTGDGVTRTCGTPTLVNVPGGAPAPTGGPIQPAEMEFAGNAQFPAPVIYATTADVVEIRLKNLGVSANPNAPNDPHSIHLHGMDVDAANDGVPETSVGAVPANSGGIGAGNVIVYMFSPKQAGTYMYHCHQEADIHVNMGMYGALVVYNPTDPAAAIGPGQGLGGALGGFQYDKDYIMMVTEMDIRGHADEEGTYGSLVPVNTWDPNPYNWALYQPQYWFINGISFPQTIHAGFPSGFAYADWLLAHPGYETLYTGGVSTPNAYWGTPGQKVLLRVINLGFETQPLHMHGYHGKIIGNDQRVWDWANKAKTNKSKATPFGQGLEKNTLTIGSGETYEWLVDFGQQAFNSLYPAGSESCYDPATGAPVPNAVGCAPIPVNGDPAAGANYVGGPTVAGIEGPVPNFDIAGFGTSQYFPFHNHDDYKATNNGSYPGGMFTMLVPTP